jgi:hypothetical protein
MLMLMLVLGFITCLPFEGRAGSDRGRFFDG